MAVFKHLAVIVFELVVLRLLVTIYLDVLGLRFLEKLFDFCNLWTIQTTDVDIMEDWWTPNLVYRRRQQVRSRSGT